MAGKDMSTRQEFDVTKARQQIATYVTQDEERSKLLSGAIQELINRENRLDEMSLELEDQKTSRSRYQQDNNELRNKITCLESKIARNAFVVVLIDGDGAIFQDNFLQDLDAGADVAAQRLSEAVRNHLTKNEPGLSDNSVSIIVRIWANLGDLGAVLCRHGSIPVKDQILRFAEAFNRSRAEYDFVNVGKGKENTDSKMRKMLNFYHNNIQCKKIIFAGCHDKGYLHDLREKLGIDGAEQRLVLLETTPAEPGFRQLGFPLIKFDSVFRSTPLGDKRKQFGLSTPNRQAVQSCLTTDTTSTPTKAVPPLSSGDKATVPKNVKISTNGGLSVSYANAGSGTEHKNVTITPSKDTRSPCILYNNLQSRLDMPIKRWDPASAASYTNKLEHIRPRAFCNLFYIVGKCPYGTLCDKEHDKDQKLAGEEIRIHRFRARSWSCTVGPGCRDFDCVFGHHCPHGRHCTKKSKCPFIDTVHGDLHYRDLHQVTPALKLVEGQHFFQEIDRDTRLFGAEN